MTVADLYNSVLVRFPELNEKFYLALLNESMRIVAEDTEDFKHLESFVMDGASVYDLSDELTYELMKIKRLQLDGVTIEKVQADMLKDVDI